MSKVPLIERLYAQPHMHQLARAVGYTGKTDDEMRPIVKELIAVHGAQKVAEALTELTIMERDTNRTILLSHVRKLCTQLLGPAPDHPKRNDLLAPLMEWRKQFEREEPEKKRGRRGR